MMRFSRSNQEVLQAASVPLWPLYVLQLLAPLTLWMMMSPHWFWEPKILYGFSVWVACLFCYAHRLVYFYHVRRAKKWVYFVIMPWVLLLYPALFMCFLFVVASQTTVGH